MYIGTCREPQGHMNIADRHGFLVKLDAIDTKNLTLFPNLFAEDFYLDSPFNKGALRFTGQAQISIKIRQTLRNRPG
jgi:hypothetical protein